MIETQKRICCHFHSGLEFIVIFIQGLNYFASVENYAEWMLYVCTLVFSVPFMMEVANHYQWAAGSLAIFCAWFNFLMYQQRLVTHTTLAFIDLFFRSSFHLIRGFAIRAPPTVASVFLMRHGEKSRQLCHRPHRINTQAVIFYAENNSMKEFM